MARRTREAPPTLSGAEIRGVVAGVDLNALAPADGWNTWVGAALRDVLVGGVSAGTIDGDLAKSAAEMIVERGKLRDFRDAVDFVHRLTSRFPGLHAPLRPVRAGLVERIEPLVVMQASAALRDGRWDAATGTVEEFLDLTERFVEECIEAAPLVEALSRLAKGGPK